MSTRQYFPLKTHDRAGVATGISFSTALSSDPAETFGFVPETVSDPGGIIDKWIFADGQTFIFSLNNINYASEKWFPDADQGAQVTWSGRWESDGAQLYEVDLSGDYSGSDNSVNILAVFSDFK